MVTSRKNLQQELKKESIVDKEVRTMHVEELTPEVKLLGQVDVRVSLMHGSIEILGRTLHCKSVNRTQEIYTRSRLLNTENILYTIIHGIRGGTL